MRWTSIQKTLFPGQQENETVYMVIRQHWFVFALKMVVWGLFVAILLVGDSMLKKYFPQISLSPYVQVYNLIKGVYLMFLMLGLFMLWVMYYLNIQIITNERIVDITQTSLISHTISELHLNRLQDVTAEVRGFFETFLDFGNVYVQTAGETTRFEFTKVSNPTAIEKLILDLYDQLPPEEKSKGQAGE
ncbi:MAG: PH domain-containing protein [Candidatus Doudnabacteria bacterium]|nr:PH domain-containing protein [Candidatus Doudnabacteria bacterium]